MKKNNISKFFNIYNILSILLTVVIFIIYRLSVSNDDFTMKLFYFNKDVLQKVLSKNSLIILSIFLIFLAFIEFYSIKYTKNKKLRNSFISNIFIKSVTIYIMLFLKKGFFIFNYLIIYLLAMNFIYFFEFLNEVKILKKRIK